MNPSGYKVPEAFGGDMIWTYKYPYRNPDWNLYPLALRLSEQELYDLRFYREEKEPVYHHVRRNRIRSLGFLSRDFSANRPSGQLAGAFFALLGPACAALGIEVFLYAFRGTVSRQFRTYGIVREHASVGRLMQMIYDDGVDVLVDMQGLMHNNFNTGLQMKPAPVQIHWLGYPGTLGMRCIDYHIADRIIIPEASRQYYREQILYMDGCYQVNNPELLVKESRFTRAELGLPEGFLFTHFNDNYKLDKHTWSIWMQILKRVPNSFLVLFVREDSLKAALEADALALDVDVSRLVYAKRLPRMDHIHRLALTDCGLDTYYCNGHTTSSDLLAAGRPVITFPRETYQARVTQSLLTAVGCTDLVCDSWDTYISKAVQLATDRAYYSYVVQRILANRERELFNPALYVERFLGCLQNI